MTRYLLDTNTVSHLIRAHPVVNKRVMAVPMTSLCVSAITAAELFFGVAKQGNAKRLKAAVSELLLRVDILPWDNAAAEQYGAARAEMEHKGKVLAPLDMLIAAHALSVDAVLVTSDRAFSQVAGLEVKDWTK